MATVELREISKETVRTVLVVEMAEEQRHFVAPTAISIPQACFERKAWFRAIEPLNRSAS